MRQRTIIRNTCSASILPPLWFKTSVKVEGPPRALLIRLRLLPQPSFRAILLPQCFSQKDAKRSESYQRNIHRGHSRPVFDTDTMFQIEICFGFWFSIPTKHFVAYFATRCDANKCLYLHLRTTIRGFRRSFAFSELLFSRCTKNMM